MNLNPAAPQPQQAQNPTYSVRGAMVLCGINDTDLFENRTAAQIIASDIFSDALDICMDKTIEEVQSDLKQYPSLTRQQGQIRTHPGNMHEIQAFIQWTRDMVRTGLDPAGTHFPVQNTAVLLKMTRVIRLSLINQRPY